MKLKVRHGDLFPTESTHIRRIDRRDFLLFDDFHRRCCGGFFLHRFDFLSFDFSRLFNFQNGKRSKLLVQLLFNDDDFRLLLHDDVPLVSRSFANVFQIEFLSELNENNNRDEKSERLGGPT